MFIPRRSDSLLQRWLQNDLASLRYLQEFLMLWFFIMTIAAIVQGMFAAAIMFIGYILGNLLLIAVIDFTTGNRYGRRKTDR